MDTKHTSLFRVTEKAMRPASTERRCFYCNTKIGDYHKESCALVKKRVMVRMIVEYEIEVPNSWNDRMVEFHRNESSWCAGNAINELQKIDDAEDKPCLCEFTKFKYLGGDTEPFLDE